MEKFGDNSYYNNKLEHFKYFYGKTSLVFGLANINSGKLLGANADNSKKEKGKREGHW